ncbi:2,3-dihydroxybenzoate-AMP ligase [Escherichia coli]|uniref:2,3-dihydroxybenzoate-AMP ligase n=1 Tax=Escherichia coli TaxID=562 RepID=A0A376LLM6_ECOLX|nr:2,3-dihydroxybenzoate-AMP ligase [Escherichia coli]
MNSSFESLIEQYPLPIAEQLRHWAARYASRIAVVDAKGSLTYSALDAQVDELAAGLSSTGFAFGGACNCAASQRQRVCYPAVRLVKTGRYPPCWRCPRNGRWDIDALIELAQPVAYVIHGENHAELARQMAHKHACLRHVLVAGETMSDDFTPLFSLHGERQAWPQPDVSTTALLLLSGGTTGTPKLHPAPTCRL